MNWKTDPDYIAANAASIMRREEVAAAAKALEAYRQKLIADAIAAAEVSDAAFKQLRQSLANANANYAAALTARGDAIRDWREANNVNP